VAEAEKLTALEPLVIDSVCDAGAAPFTFCRNDNEPGDDVSVAFVPTVRITLIVCGLLATVVGDVAVRVMVAVYLPIPRLAGLAVMDRFEGVTPVEVFTNSQPAPPVE